MWYGLLLQGLPDVVLEVLYVEITFIAVDKLLRDICLYLVIGSIREVRR